MIVLMLSKYHRRITHGERTACDVYRDEDGVWLRGRVDLADMEAVERHAKEMERS